MTDFEIYDGGPAFPHPNPNYAQDYGRKDHTPPFGGMSLRDYLAIHADVSGTDIPNLKVAAEFVGDKTAPSIWDFPATTALMARVVAKMKYMAADAMLAAREGGAK